MTNQLPYTTASAFNTALKARLAAAAETSVHGINELRRQFAYDRLLIRIFAADPDRWILKGAAGLLARRPEGARHSKDIDMYYRGEISVALDELRNLAADDTVGDFFTFDIERLPDRGDSDSAGLRVISYVGDLEFQRFSIDLVIDSNMTQEPETIAALRPVPIDGLPTADYRVYPLVDHVADKHAAMIDTYHGGAASTRYRDLVDLALIATTYPLAAVDLRAALHSEYAHRGLDIPATVDLPDSSWEAGYAKVAATVPHLALPTATEALEIVRALLEPLLGDEFHSGHWDPNRRRWS